MANAKQNSFTGLAARALAVFCAVAAGATAPQATAQAPTVAQAGPPRAQPRARRAWKVFVFHTSHCDPGWHDLPSKIMEKHARYLDTLVELCDRTRNEPPERRFVFTYEHSWPVDYYERTRPKEKFEKLMEVCRRGQIEVGAIYASVHTELCGHEELARLTAYATGLRKRYGIRVQSAMLNDVSEGCTMGLPQVLARSGIRSIVFGPGVKAVVRGIQPDLPRLFQWTTPDGSRVLVGWTPGFWTYTTWGGAGYAGPVTLRQFEALGKAYPYDAILLPFGPLDAARWPKGAAVVGIGDREWDCPSVALDAGVGVLLALEHLQALGHRCALYLGRRSPRSIDQEDRVRAFRAGVDKLSLVGHEHFIPLEAPSEALGASGDGAVARGKRIMRRRRCRHCGKRVTTWEGLAG